MDLSCWQNTLSYVAFYAIVTTSAPMVEHINGRRYWNFMELYGTSRLEEKFRNFMELNNGYDGTEQLWKQEAQLSLGWPTVLPHSRSMQKLWCIHANRSSHFLVIGIARFSRNDPKCNQIVPWSLHTFPENFTLIGPVVFSYCCWQRN